MTAKRKAPYQHSDGSGCWTNWCSRRFNSTQTEKLMETARDEMIYANYPALVQEFETGVKPEKTVEQLEADKKFNKAQKLHAKTLAREEEERKAKTKQPHGETILERNDPRFLETLRRKGW